jgi:hypothetical protein
VTELSDAIASRREHNGLSPAERAAAETDLHMSTCAEPRIDDCGDCQLKLARIRRLVDVVRPVVEREARAAERAAVRERLDAEAARVRAAGRPTAALALAQFGKALAR